MQKDESVAKLMSSDGPDMEGADMQGLPEPIKSIMEEFHDLPDQPQKKSSDQPGNVSEELNLPLKRPLQSSVNLLSAHLPNPGIDETDEALEEVVQDAICPECALSELEQVPVCCISSCHHPAVEFMFCGDCTQKLKDHIAMRLGVECSVMNKSDLSTEQAEQFKLPIPQRKKKQAAASRYKSKKFKPIRSTVPPKLQQKKDSILPDELNLPHIGLAQALGEGQEEKSKESTFPESSSVVP